MAGDRPLDTDLLETVEGNDPTVGEGGAVPVELQVGDSVGRYSILGRIGSGGMGVVYSAYDPELDRKIALKLLHRERSGGTTVSAASGTSTSGGRLLREARAMARLSHPNVIAVHDVGTYQDRVFVAMEFIDGETLTDWLEREDREWDRIVTVLREAGKGLAHAHAAGLVHRDFKPDNVMISVDGRVRVLDFGLARSRGEARPASITAETSSTQPLSRLSQTGALVGTPAYMSPEQHLGEPFDARSNQFSFCVAAWESLYGMRPFAGDTVPVLAFQVTQGELRAAPREAGVPAWVQAALTRGLTTDPGGRWPSMGALLEALAPRATRRAPVWLAAVGVAVLGGVAGGWALAGSEAPACREAGQDLTGVWNAERKAALRSALGAAGTPHAVATADRVVARVEARSTRWRDAATEACAATTIRGERSPRLLDRSNACLSGRLRELDALLTVLEGGEPGVVQRAQQAVQSLPPIAPCLDPSHLLAAIEPPTDPALAASVDALRAEIAEVEAMELAGLWERADRRVTALPDRFASALQYRAVAAELLFLRGQLRQRVSDITGAVPLLQEAYVLARTIDHRVIAAQSASELALLNGDQVSKFEQALLWAQLAHVEAERGMDDPNIAGNISSHLGTIYFAQGEYGKAREHYERALEQWERRGDDTLGNQAGVRVNLANVSSTMGEFDRARRELSEAKDTLTLEYGESHPDVIAAVNNMGMLEYQAGDLGRSIELSRKALELATKNLGAFSDVGESAMTNIANVQYELGEYDAALATYEDLLESGSARMGPNSISVAGLHSNIGNVLAEQKRFDQAIASFEASLRGYEAAVGPGHPRSGFPLQGMGSALVTMERFEEAVPVLRRAIAAWEKQGENHPLVAWPLTSLGRAELGLGRFSDAAEHFERAVGIRSSGEADDPILAESRLGLAQALASSDPIRARQLASAARAAFEADENSESVADADAVLADIPLVP